MGRWSTSAHPCRTVRVVTELDASYVRAERRRAVAWKLNSPSIPSEAHKPAEYIGDTEHEFGRLPYCLPSNYAALTLLPEVREQTLELFKALRIPWHPDGLGPSNHLLSSQVQCVNALGQMVSDPARITRAFAGLLGTAEPLQIEPGRFLTFEFIGDTDFFNEAEGGQRTRGSHCTSVDAALLHRTIEGIVELVLIEWKYTESYRPRRPDGRDQARQRRYEAALKAPGSPINHGLMPFDCFLDEPLYQLMRQQLFAHLLEMSRAHDADRVRVLHVLPKSNLAYQQSVHRDEVRALGSTVGEVWARLLRTHDRFISVDSSVFLDPRITSPEYVARYGPATNEAT